MQSVYYSFKIRALGLSFKYIVLKMVKRAPEYLGWKNELLVWSIGIPKKEHNLVWNLSGIPVVTDLLEAAQWILKILTHWEHKGLFAKRLFHLIFFCFSGRSRSIFITRRNRKNLLTPWTSRISLCCIGWV